MGLSGTQQAQVRGTGRLGGRECEILCTGLEATLSPHPEDPAQAHLPSVPIPGLRGHNARVRGDSGRPISQAPRCTQEKSWPRLCTAGRLSPAPPQESLRSASSESEVRPTTVSVMPAASFLGAKVTMRLKTELLRPKGGCC